MYCGVSLQPHRTGKVSYRVSQSEGHEVQGLRQARCLGQLVQGRYVPRVILEQLELIAPVQSEAAGLKRSSGWFPHSVLNSPGGNTVRRAPLYREVRVINHLGTGVAITLTWRCSPAPSPHLSPAADAPRPLHRDELDETIHVWDSHVIRPSKNDRVPSGRPRVMYMFTELYTSDDHISPVDRADVQLCQSNCTFRPAVPCDTDIYNICNILMVESQLHLPDDAYQALDLYLHFRSLLETPSPQRNIQSVGEDPEPRMKSTTIFTFCNLLACSPSTIFRPSRLRASSIHSHHCFTSAIPSTSYRTLSFPSTPTSQ
ncbi:hypothetical protein PAMA_009029 [Pampus argenteus]